MGPPGFQGGELGSGVIIESRGYVVTITTSSGRRANRRQARSVLKFRPDCWAPIPRVTLPCCRFAPTFSSGGMGDSDQLDIGDWVLAIGAPLGFDHSVTAASSRRPTKQLRIAEYDRSYKPTPRSTRNSGGP